MCLRSKSTLNLIIVLLGVTIFIVLFMNNNNNGFDQLYALVSIEGELPIIPILNDSSLKAELFFQQEIEREGGNTFTCKYYDFSK